MKHTVILSLAGGALASFTGNINYFSPSLNHPELGVSIRKVAARTYAKSPWDPKVLNFTHGVASGDPYEDSVILWTRIAPTSDNDKSNVTVSGHVDLFSHEVDDYIKASKAPVCVDWKISTTKDLKTLANSGTAYTSSDVDFTVKVEARKLQPFTQYYYQFTVCDSNNTSPLGRTKTIPAKDGKASQPIKLAVYSCSNYPFGFFNAYGNTVRKDSVDYVIHLGDYIYEYKNGDYGWGDAYGRVPEPNNEIHTLYDYRKRIAQYRTDLDLYASHQQFPWIPVWDDHEVADNTWKAGSAHLNNSEDSFLAAGGISADQRKMNAVRAYFEWMPIRQYDRDVTDVYYNTHFTQAISDDTNRSLMGPRQEQWFYRMLRESSRRGTAWRVVGNQIIFSRLNQSGSYNMDAWDGYQANRNRTFANLYDHKINNTLFLAGDSHASWVSDLVWLGEHAYDNVTGAGSVGVEFAGSAVSSPSPVGQNITLANANARSAAMVAANRELQWQDFYYRGYYELSIGYDAVNASFFGVPTTKTRNGYEISLSNFTVLAGANRLQRSVSHGVVESGALQSGKPTGTNLTHDTATGKWFVFKE
ncbi:PhoD-like phosphatase [Coniochaeta sp. 2T2.1]|nr:PhoD-like phosphatase [Coniochaeta sp. 2T2.1]